MVTNTFQSNIILDMSNLAVSFTFLIFRCVIVLQMAPSVTLTPEQKELPRCFVCSIDDVQKTSLQELMRFLRSSQELTWMNFQ